VDHAVTGKAFADLHEAEPVQAPVSVAGTRAMGIKTPGWSCCSGRPTSGLKSLYSELVRQQRASLEQQLTHALNKPRRATSK
jgi:hypothetical protein